MKKYLVRGTSIDEIIIKASNILKVSPSDIKHEVVNITKSMLGKIKEIELKVWVELKPVVICDDNMENCIIPSDNRFEEDMVNEEKEEDVKEKEELIQIQILKSGIYLMVKIGEEISKEKEKEIFQEILLREIKYPISEEIKKAITVKRGEFVKIAEYNEDYYVDAKAQITVGKKDMEAILEILPPERGNHITKEKIDVEILKLGIKYGIDEYKIEKAIKEKKYKEQIVIAEGKYPIDGEDAKIIHFFETTEKIEFKADDSGKINYKEMSNTIKNTKSGDKISQKIPATKGINGMDIFGNEIESKPGKDKFFFKGKNVKESENGFELLSSIDGRITVVNQMINVYPILQVDGDIDLSIGNVDFVGSIFIKGKISEGFYVKALGDIIVDGFIEDAVVEASGNLLVRNGIVGRENGTGKIKVQGEIQTKFIQNIFCEAGGKIEVKDQILNSIIESKDSIVVFGGKGKIIGGKISATKEIIANEVGNDYETLTVLEVGITPYERKRRHELEEMLNKNESEREKNEHDIKTLTALKEQGGLDEKKNKTYLEKVKMQFIFAKEKKEMINEYEKLERVMSESKSGKIHVRNIMHSGVIFRIGDNQLNVKENFKFVTFYIDKEKQEISLIPFEKDNL